MGSASPAVVSDEGWGVGSIIGSGSGAGSGAGSGGGITGSVVDAVGSGTTGSVEDAAGSGAGSACGELVESGVGVGDAVCPARIAASWSPVTHTSEPLDFFTQSISV